MTNMNFFEGPRTTRLLVLGLIFLAGMYVGYVFNISSINQEVLSSKQQENDLKQQLHLVIEKNTAVKYDLNQLPALKIKLHTWKKSIIEFPKLTELLNDILKVGANKQLYFASFNPGDAIASGTYSKIPISVTVVGNYHQIAGFLSAVANLPSIVEIDHFSISNDDTNAKLGTKLAAASKVQNLLTAELTLNVFFVPLKPNAPVTPVSEVKK